MGLIPERGQGHGAEALIALLREDAAARAAALDIVPVFTVAPARRRFGSAVVLLLFALVPLFASSTYAYFGQRFLCCWFAPRAGYRMEVVPASATLAAGRPVTIRVQVISEDARVPLPKACVLVLPEVKDAARHIMQADKDEFTFTLEKLTGDLDYRIEAGELTSAVFHLTAIQPIELANGSPLIEVTPPPYVNRDIHPAVAHTANADFSALQFSVVRIDFRFSRAPVAVRFQVRRVDQPNWTEPVLQWNRAEQQAFALIPAAEVGSFTGLLTMEAEHGIKSTHVMPHWKVWPDEPPVFTRLPRLPTSAERSGEDGARKARPDDVISLGTVVEDKVGVDRLEVEYRVNGGPSAIEEIARGEGKPALHSEAIFKLFGKVKEGDVVRWRLRASDNRRLAKGQVAANVPERELAPNVTHEPAPKDGADQWSLLKISTQADPLQTQEIMAQRDEVRALVEDIQKQLNDERAQLEKARAAAQDQPLLTTETARALGQARALNDEIIQSLTLLGLHALDEPALTALAERAFDIAESELGRSASHLAKAEARQLDSAARAQEMKEAEEELARALARLKELVKVNERLAEDRLDQMRMELLAQRQEELGKKMRDRAKNNGWEKELGSLRAEQDKIARELDDLAEQSRLFREALQAFREGQAKQLAQRARERAREQRAAAQEKLARDLKIKLAELARKQEDLAGRAEQLGREARGKKTAPQFPEAKEAAEALQEAKIVFALQAQEKFLRDLARLAGDLDPALDMGKTPREAALKLLQAQERIRKDLEHLGEEFPSLTDKQTRARLQDILGAQQNLVKAMSKLETPANLPKALAAKTQAEDMVGQVENYLKTRDGLAAFNKMEEALAALRHLAATLPEEPPVSPKDTPEQKADRQKARQAQDLAREQKDLLDAVRKALEESLSDPDPAPLDAAQAKLDDQQRAPAKEMGTKMQAEGKSENSAGNVTGKAFQESQEEVANSRKQLGEGAATQAQSAMRKAAKALQNAAQAALEQMASEASASSQGSPGSPTSSQAGARSSGQTTSRFLSKELEKYPGKSWGQLPGELRTRLIQDLRARYGDDYALIIQRYFQQLADVPTKKR